LTRSHLTSDGSPTDSPSGNDHHESSSCRPLQGGRRKLTRGHTVNLIRDNHIPIIRRVSAPHGRQITSKITCNHTCDHSQTDEVVKPQVHKTKMSTWHRNTLISSKLTYLILLSFAQLTLGAGTIEKWEVNAQDKDNVKKLLSICHRIKEVEIKGKSGANRDPREAYEKQCKLMNLIPNYYDSRINSDKTVIKEALEKELNGLNITYYLDSTTPGCCNAMSHEADSMDHGVLRDQEINWIHHMTKLDESDPISNGLREVYILLMTKLKLDGTIRDHATIKTIVSQAVQRMNGFIRPHIKMWKKYRTKLPHPQAAKFSKKHEDYQQKKSAAKKAIDPAEHVTGKLSILKSFLETADEKRNLVLDLDKEGNAEQSVDNIKAHKEAITKAETLYDQILEYRRQNRRKENMITKRELEKYNPRSRFHPNQIVLWQESANYFRVYKDYTPLEKKFPIHRIQVSSWKGLWQDETSKRVYGFHLKAIDLAKEYEVAKKLHANIKKNSKKRNKPEANSPEKTSTAVSPRKETGIPYKRRSHGKKAQSRDSSGQGYPGYQSSVSTPKSPRKIQKL